MKLRHFSHHRHLLSIAALILVASATLLLAACGSTSDTNTATSTPTATATQQQSSTPASTVSSGGNTVQVSIVENNGIYSFSPATLTIAKGTTVVWTNKSDAPHTVTSDTSDTQAFGSSTLSESKTFQTVFATAGTFTYHCEIHAYMKATIIVTA
jgi:plastocyanin